MTQRILIIGAGFGGMWSALSAARLLDLHARRDVEVAVLAPQAELRVRPRFYEPEVHRMVAPLGELFDAVGVTFIQGSADAIDVHSKTVRYRNDQGQSALVAYDRLVLASGSQVVRPQLAGMEHAFDVDQLDEAVRLERHLQALATKSPSAARNTVVVAGGGFTGIETAAEMPARLRAVLGADAAVRVVVVDRGSEIGAALGEGPRAAIVEASEQLGLEWRLSSSVVQVDAGGVTLDSGERIAADTVIWTVGVRASSLAEQVPGQRDAQGRLHVDDNLLVHGLDAVFATGDVARAVVDDAGNHALMSCQHAIALGRSAGNNAAASLIGVTPIAYRQPKYVTCLDLGGWGAVFTEGWDRQVKLEKAEGKALKQQINSQWIYPPVAERSAALAAADPLIPVVA